MTLEEAGLELIAVPLLGGAYQVTIHGMLKNDEMSEQMFSLQWKDTEIWQAVIWQGYSTHVHYSMRTNLPPLISEFTVTRSEAPRPKETRVGLCRFSISREFLLGYDWED
jgi:hypothetical protein